MLAVLVVVVAALCPPAAQTSPHVPCQAFLSPRLHATLSPREVACGNNRALAAVMGNYSIVGYPDLLGLTWWYTPMTSFSRHCGEYNIQHPDRESPLYPTYPAPSRLL